AMETVPIMPMEDAFQDGLAGAFAGAAADVTEENLQSRIRGTLLMELSNKRRAQLLTTGNKSEMATGYATLYGQMNDAFKPLMQVYKSLVYRLAHWRNAHHHPMLMGARGVVIAPRILTKAPSAELRPNQTDQDSLPPYDVLDAILEGLI